MGGACGRHPQSNHHYRGASRRPANLCHCGCRVRILERISSDICWRRAGFYCRIFLKPVFRQVRGRPVRIKRPNTNCGRNSSKKQFALCSHKGAYCAYGSSGAFCLWSRINLRIISDFFGCTTCPAYAVCGPFCFFWRCAYTAYRKYCLYSWNISCWNNCRRHWRMVVPSGCHPRSVNKKLEAPSYPVRNESRRCEDAHLLAPALKKRVRTVSKRLGLPEGEVINRAVSAYLADVENVQNLYQELAAWDEATADSMRSEKF